MSKAKKAEDPFEDPRRDELITSGEIQIDPRYVQCLNMSELVQLCNLIDPEARVHRGISREVLEEILTRAPSPKGTGNPSNPVDRYRKLIRAFFKVYWKKVKDQIDPKCDGDCYRCHDIVVLSCYIVNHKRLQQFRSKRAIKETANG